MQTILWVVGVLMVMGGIFALLRRRWLWGTLEIVLGILIGGFGFFAS